MYGDRAPSDACVLIQYIKAYFITKALLLGDLAVVAADSKPVKIAFAKILREARLAAGRTQQQIADSSDYDVVYVSNLESAKYQPSLSALLAIERALDLKGGTLAARTLEAMESA